MSDEIKHTVQRQPRDHNPKARSEADGGQGRKHAEERDFANESRAPAAHDSKQHVERAYDG